MAWRFTMQAEDKKRLERGFAAVAAIAASIGVLTTTLTSAPRPVTAAPTSLAVPAQPTESAEPSIVELDATERAAPSTTQSVETDTVTTEPAAAEPESPESATSDPAASDSAASGLTEVGTVAEADTVAALRSAVDLSTDDAHVLRLYEAFYGRQPDLDGARFWIGERRAGTSIDEIADAFARSDEFAITYGELSDASFVESAYRTALGREIDTDGFAFWVVELERGVSRESVLVFFTSSDEFATASNHRRGEPSSGQSLSS